MTSASDILKNAAEIVEGSRNVTHGEKERSFTAIAAGWNWYLFNRKEGSGHPISARDVAQMMVIMKVARSIQGTRAPDHFLDSAGYSAIAGELASQEDK